jgi:hypothetical protein
MAKLSPDLSSMVNVQCLNRRGDNYRAQLAGEVRVRYIKFKYYSFLSDVG